MRVLVGRVDRRPGLGLLRRPRILETERRTMANVKHVRPTSPPSTVTVQYVTIQSKSASGARPSAELWMRILKLKIDCMRRQTPHRWVSSSFLTSYGLRLFPSPRFLRFRLPATSAHICVPPTAFSLLFEILSSNLPSNSVISLVLSPPLLLRPLSDFDKLNSPTFPNSLFFPSVVLSASSPGEANDTFGIVSHRRSDVSYVP
jgi:hypothetical protein